MNARIRNTNLYGMTIAAALLGGLPGCARVLGEQPVLAFEFGVRVQSDDGRPIAGAEVVSSAGTVRTDAEGQAALVMRGHEGDRQPHVVTCPPEYQSPATPLLVSLRRGFERGNRPVYDATCVPLKRTVVVSVRLEDGPGLPIVYLGKEVARTDASGAAHVLLHVEPDEPFRLLVDTSEPGLESFRPQNPSAELSVGHTDDLLVFEQKMSLFVPKVAAKPRYVRAAPKRL